MSCLPGMFPAGAIAAAGLAPLAAVAFNTSSAAATITGPAAIQAGDLLVLWDVATGITSAPGSVVPSGFTQIFNRTFTAGSLSIGRGILSRKIATGSEASASIAGMSGSDSGKCLYVFRGNVPIVDVLVGSIASQDTEGNPTPQIVAASGQPPPLVVIGAYGAISSIDPRTFSPTKDGEISAAGGEVWLAYKIYNSSPQNVTIDQDDEGSSNILGSCYLACS